MFKLMKNITITLISAALIFSTSVACSQKSNNDSKSSAENSQSEKKESNSYSDEYLTDIEKFKSSMSDNNIVILDARGDDAYKKGHIKGAISVSWKDFTNQTVKPGEKDWGVILPKDELAKKIGEIGVNKEKNVIVYGNKDAWGEDGRIVWMLRMAGINATMLNGGIDLWESEKNEVTKEESKAEVVDFKIDALDSSMNISTNELKKDYDNFKVIDVRDKDEYEGATKFGEARGGHLPKAINLQFSESYNEDGTIKKIDDLKKLFKEKGLNLDDQIVTYCTGGIRSAHLALILKMSGYENVKNYDASYYEWAGDSTNTIE